MNDEPRLDEIAGQVLDWLRANPVMVLLLVVAVLVAYSASTVVFTVDRDEQAVILRLGAYERLVGPGLRVKWPAPIETAHIINTQRVFTKEFGFRTREAGVQSRRIREGYDNEALMLTGDLGVARVEWVVHYRRQQPRNYLFNVQNEERLIRDASEEAVRRIVGDFDATDVITVARVQIAKDVKDEMQRIMNKYNAGIFVDDLLIQSTEPPEPVIPAFKEVDSARQDRDRLRYEAEQEREQVINEAKGTAEKIVEEAQGDSAAMINLAQGDYERFNRVLMEYRNAPQVTEDRLFLERMETVLDRAGSVYVVDEGLPSVLPHLNVEGENVAPGGGR